VIVNEGTVIYTRVQVVGGANHLAPTSYSHSRPRSFTVTVRIPDTFGPFLTKGFRLFLIISEG
jgi:hypothetical protein